MIPVKFAKFLEILGINKPVREMYRHSIQSEIKYHLSNKISGDRKILKEIDGFRIILNTSTTGLEKDLLINNIRERDSVEILKKELENGMNVIDIGANIGYYTLIEAKEIGPSGNVKALEPDGKNYIRLLENLRLNNFSNIDAINKGVGAEKTAAQIIRDPAPNRHRIADSYDQGQEVKLDTVDNLTKDMKPDLVRMDVEGYELEILKGMKETLAKDSLKLFIEIHPENVEKFYNDSMKEIWEILSENGFKAKYLIRHPSKIRLSHFLKKNHPPREVIKTNSYIEDVLDTHSEFFKQNRTFRIFLEK